VLYKRGNLSADKIERLQCLPWWSWAESFSSRWTRRYEEISQLPDCPQSGSREYDWVRTQRRQYEAGRLPQEQIAACQAIPWWSWASNTTNWKADYEAIRQLPARPAAATKEYDWVKHQRSMHAKGRLLEERIDLLEEIDWWSWRTGTDERWLERWKAIKTLPQPPASTTPEYHWVVKQKKRKASGVLEPDRMARCQEIEWWSWT
jgi:hypothetical protein